MRVTVLIIGLGIYAYGCNSSSGGLKAGTDSGADATSGRGGTLGGSGGSTVEAGGVLGTGGSAAACAEPIPCDGFDNRPDANLTAVISCLSPSTAPLNATLTLSIYGHHLATGPGDNAIVVIGSGSPLNGVPATACHLDVQVPANQLSAPGQVSVTVSPGGWTRASAPVSLTIR